MAPRAFSARTQHKPIGPAPFVGDVEPGRHKVRVSAEGYFDVERDVIGDLGNTGRFDLEIYTQVVWNTGHGHPFQTTLLKTNLSHLANLPFTRERRL